MTLRIGLACLVLAAMPALAADPLAGRQSARPCAVCHGPMGVSVAIDAPHLAGQPARYLATQLRAYRSGARQHEVMSVMAKPLTDAEIDNLADWFSSLRISVQPFP